MMRFVLAAGLTTLLLLAHAGAPASAEAPWEQQVRAAVKVQNDKIRAAAREGSIARVLSEYQALLSRQRTVLNVYLLGRALYYGAIGDLQAIPALMKAKKTDQAKAVQQQARAKASQAVARMQEVLQAEPRFWFAHRGLARLHSEMQRPNDALRHVQLALQARPRDAQNLQVALAVYGQAKRYADVVRFANQLLELDPKDIQSRMALVNAYVAQQKLDEAIRELEPLVRAVPGEPTLRLDLALLYYRRAMRGVKQGAKPKAADLRKGVNHAWQVQRLRPNSYEILGLLEEMYVNLVLLEQKPKEKSRLEEVLKRMQPLAPNAAETKRVEDNLRRLLDGSLVARKPKADPRPKDAGTQLIEDALDPRDVDKRRTALQKLLDARIPFVPRVLYARLDPKLEADAQCRALLIRILGQLEVVESVRHIARGLRDESTLVRAVAADELGRYTHKGILLYLEPVFFNLQIAELPAARPGRKALQREYNAIRSALNIHTQFRDRELMATGAIPVEKLLDNRKRWIEYFRSERGAEAFLQAIEVFKQLDDPYPEFYLLIRVIGEHEDMLVRRAAYDYLKQHAAKVASGDDAHMKRRWSQFPQFDSASITDETLAAKRKTMQAWIAWLRKPAQPPAQDQPGK